jgi:type 2A phosphatase activator TIP41
VKPFDWSYTTDYKGTITKGKPFELEKENAEPIPIELLKRPDPILFFEEVVLFESELDDNGISILSCKLRVMPDRMLLLCRQFMRLDDVLVRIRDTRIYVDFNLGKVIRDYTEKEDGFDKVKKVQLPPVYFYIFRNLCTLSFAIECGIHSQVGLDLSSFL